MICSAFYGSTGAAAIGLLNPYFSLMGMLSAFLIIGTQKTYVNALCKGNQEKAVEAFSSSCIAAIFLAVTISTLCVVFATPIVKFLGATNESPTLQSYGRQYLYSLAFGSPFSVLTPILIPIAQLAGEKRAASISLLMTTIIDIILDILAGVLDLGLHGMGLATSISFFVSFLILVIPLVAKKKFPLKLNAFRLRTLGEIVRFGMPKATKRLCNVARPVTLNKQIIYFAGAIGMSAMSVRNGLNDILSCCGAALGAAVMSLVIFYSSEGNVHALARVKKRVLLYLIFPISVISLLVSIFAEPLVGLYHLDSAEGVRLATTAIFFVSIDLVLYAFFESVSSYWQGIGEVRTVNIIVVLVKLGFPLLSVFVLGTCFGLIGVWMSFPVSTFFSILAFCVASLVKYKKLSFFPIPATCQSTNHSFEYTVDKSTTSKEISEKVESVQRFCLENGLDQHTSFFAALCIEEITYGIQEYCSFTKGNKNFINFFFTIQDSHAVIRVLDNSREFDAVAFYHAQTFNPEHPESHIGIRLVMEAATDIHYANIYGMNCLTVKL